MADLSPSGKAALEYRRRGWFIYPALPGTKRARNKGWLEALLSVRDILEHWSEWPEDNVGLLVEPSGLLVVDIDSYKKEFCPQALEKLCLDTDTAWVSTPNGGTHYIYKAPSEMAGLARSLKEFPCIEVFHTKGGVMLPPSRVEGQHKDTYIWGRDTPALKDTPDAVLHNFTRQHRRDRVTEPLPADSHPDSQDIEAIVLLETAPNTECDYTVWRNIIYAMYNTYAGSPNETRALNACVSWSQRWEQPPDKPPRSDEELEQAVHKIWQRACSLEELQERGNEAIKIGTLKWHLKDSIGPYDLSNLGLPPPEEPLKSPAESLKIPKVAAVLVPIGQDSVLGPSQMVPYQVETWVQNRQVTTLVAPGGTGKSTLLQGLAFALASGCETMLELRLLQGACKVAYYHGEEDVSIFNDRCNAAERYYSVMPGMEWARVRENLYLITPERFKFDFTTAGPERMAELIVLLRGSGIEALFIDSLTKIHSGEENKAQDMEKVMESLNILARQADISIVLLHHSRKASGDNITVDNAADYARGSSVIINNSRSVYYLVHLTVDQATTYGVRPEDRLQYIQMVNAKSNYAPRSDYRPTFYIHSEYLDYTAPYTYRGKSLDLDLYRQISRGTPVITRVTLSEDPTCFAVSPNSSDWIGHSIAEIMRVDIGPTVKGASVHQMEARNTIKAVIAALEGGAYIEAIKISDMAKSPKKYLLTGKAHSLEHAVDLVNAGIKP